MRQMIGAGTELTRLHRGPGGPRPDAVDDGRIAMWRPESIKAGSRPLGELRLEQPIAAAVGSEWMSVTTPDARR